MATVRFSDELKTDIRKAAYGLLSPQVLAARASLDITGWADKVYYHVVPAHYAQHINALPSDMFHFVDEITVEMIHDKVVQAKLSFGGKRAWPQRLTNVSGVKQSRYSTTELNLMPTAENHWADMLDVVGGWQARVNAAEEARKQFVEKVMTLVSGFATLSPALKAWPPLWDLIPEATKNKHKEIVERAAKKGPVEIDMSDATAVVTVSKFKM